MICKECGTSIDGLPDYLVLHQRRCRSCYARHQRKYNSAYRRRKNPSLVRVDFERAHPPAVDAVTAAYLAGFFDGEGSIGLYQHRSVRTRYVIVVQVGNLHRPTVDLFMALFGGHLGVRRKPGYRDLWGWKLSGFRALNALRVMLPYLRQKRPQADVALTYRAMPGIRWSDDRESEMMSIKSELKRLRLSIGEVGSAR